MLSVDPLSREADQGAEPRGIAASNEFERIFEAEAPYVGRTLRYLGVHSSIVEDLCQEVFLVVHRRLQLTQEGSLRAWVRRICVHVAQNYHRSLRRRREDLGAVPEPEVAASQVVELERAELRQRLLQLLDALSPEQRAAFVLFEIEELTMQETAQALQCPLQTAYSRLYAARARMKAVLERPDA